MTHPRVRLDLAPADYVQLLDLVDAKIRSERARASAFRSRRDTSNEMQALGIQARLTELRQALENAVRGGADE